MDYPTAWSIVRATNMDHHHEHCSYRTQNGGILCDCAAMESAQHVFESHVVSLRRELAEARKIIANDLHRKESIARVRQQVTYKTEVGRAAQELRLDEIAETRRWLERNKEVGQ